MKDTIKIFRILDINKQEINTAKQLIFNIDINRYKVIEYANANNVQSIQQFLLHKKQCQILIYIKQEIKNIIIIF